MICLDKNHFVVSLTETQNIIATIKRVELTIDSGQEVLNILCHISLFFGVKDESTSLFI